MTYEPKVGDEVMLRGSVVSVNLDSAAVYIEIAGGRRFKFPIAWVLPAPNAADDLLTGHVTGPWASALSAAMEKLEERVRALEGSKSAAGGAATDFPPLLGPLPIRARGRVRPLVDVDEVRDARGRVLKSKTLDVDPQGDWSSASPAPRPVDSFTWKETSLGYWCLSFHPVDGIGCSVSFDNAVDGKLDRKDMGQKLHWMADQISPRSDVLDEWRETARAAEERVEKVRALLTNVRESESHRGWQRACDMVLAWLDLSEKKDDPA